MIQSTYRSGFIDECIRLGLTKKASSDLYSSSMQKRGGVLNFLGGIVGLGSRSPLVRGLGAMGRFSARHPVLGALTYTAPTAFLTNQLNRTSNRRMIADTLTPYQENLLNRSGSYKDLGFGNDDFFDFGYM